MAAVARSAWSGRAQMGSVSRAESDRFAVAGRGRRLHGELVGRTFAEGTEEHSVADLQLELACMGPGELDGRLRAVREHHLDPAVEAKTDDTLDHRLVRVVPVLRTQDLDVVWPDELFAHPGGVAEEAHDEG